MPRIAKIVNVCRGFMVVSLSWACQKYSISGLSSMMLLSAIIGTAMLARKPSCTVGLPRRRDPFAVIECG